ncbi:hypothetical protein NPIL_33741 [Nephila pilipes]|uniref:Uncharacterized protein n=1 Tax=Nephila pilipes TaxID=299642 RepID=A0A8X6R118_NEPPI|nr:hypothetical protein NPIL_33741 [Nephila pilipes]
MNNLSGNYTSSPYDILRQQIEFFIQEAKTLESTCKHINEWHGNISDAFVEITRRAGEISEDTYSPSERLVFETTRLLYSKYEKLVRSVKFVLARIQRHSEVVLHLHSILIRFRNKRANIRLDVFEDFSISVWLLSQVLFSVYTIVNELKDSINDADKILEPFIFKEIWL